LIPCAYVREARIGDKTVEIVRQPPGCIRTPSTYVEVVKRVKVERERRNGFCLVRSPYKLVLPGKACDILDAVEEGKTPRAILLGPPGTGKSKLLDLVRLSAPINVVEIEPEAMLSKYVGETEAKVMKKFKEAEDNQPSIILMDEADLFIEERSLGGGGVESGMREVSASVVRILLRKLQEWSDRRMRVGLLASSNRSVKSVDTALIRGERAEVIYFPVPTREAVKLLAELYGVEVSDDEIRDLLRKALSFANIAEYFRTGKIREFQPVSFAYVEYGEPVELRFKAEGAGRFIIAEEPPLGYRLAAIMSASLYDKPVLLVTDVKRIDDVFLLGRSMELPLGIPYSPYTDYNTVMSYDYPYPIFFIGQNWRIPLPRFTLEMLESLCRGGRRELYRAMGCGDARTRDELVKCLAGIKV
jgi:hypothetical protein